MTETRLKVRILDPDRAAVARETFGTDVVPVIGPPSLAIVQGTPAVVYELDCERIDFEKLVAIQGGYGARFGLTDREGYEEIRSAGIPVKVEGTELVA